MTNMEIVQRIYRAFADRDYDTFKSLCSPKLEWIQTEGFPNGGRHLGADAVVENVLKSFKSDWENWRFETAEHLDAGDTIIVIGAYSGQHLRTGKAFRAATAHVYDLSGGKIVRFRQFTDTKVIADALR